VPFQSSGAEQWDAEREWDADPVMERADAPVELASTYVLLASSESSYATGQIYGVVGANAR
jgi:hypothetical protein